MKSQTAPAPTPEEQWLEELSEDDSLKGRKWGELKRRQDLFARMYVANGGHCTQAYRAAGYAGADKSYAPQQAWKCLQGQFVQQRIEHYQLLRARKLDVRDAAILAELRFLAFADIGQFRNQEGRLLAPEELPATARAAVKRYREIHTAQGAIVYEYELHDKLKALGQLATLKGLSADKGANKGRKVRIALQGGTGAVEVEG